MNEVVPDGWSAMEIGEALELECRSIRPEDDTSYELISIRRRHGGMFPRESLRGREILTKAMQRVVPGNFVIARRQIVHGACAIAADEFASSIMSMSYSSFRGTIRCLPDYFFRLAQQPKLVKYFWDASHGVVVEKLNFQQEDWLQRSVTLPPVEEQRRIIEILDTIDNAIQISERLIVKHQALYDGLASVLFTGGLSNKPLRPVPSEWIVGRPQRFHEFPSDWRVANLSRVAGLESGHTPARRNPTYWGGAIPWVSLHDTARLDFDVITVTSLTVTESGIQNSSARVLPTGTTALSRTATVGKAVEFGRPMATSQDFACFLPNREIAPRFLLHLFRHLAPVWRELAAGSTHQTIYMPTFRRLEVALPPPAEQRSIVERLEAARAVVERELAARGRFERLRTGLAADLLSGRVRTVNS
jgi:type I restriction enzyme, S subunit